MFKSVTHQGTGAAELKRRFAVSVDPADRDAAMAYLNLCVQWLGTGGSTDQEKSRMAQFCEVLQEDPSALKSFSHAVSICLMDADLFPMLTESGIVLSRSLGKELSRRIKHKIIPPLRSPGDFRDVIDAIFPGRDDFRWVEAIGAEGWSRLFSMLRFEMAADVALPRRQVRQALNVISVRVAQLGCEPDIDGYLPSEGRGEENPFLRQHQALAGMEGGARPGEKTGRSEGVQAVRDALADCLRGMRHIREHMPERGASLSQTYILYQLDRLMARMTLLLDIIDGDGRVDTRQLAAYFIRLVRHQNRRYSLREFLSQTTGYVAYQIAEQKGRKGDHYITQGRSDYLRMLSSAMLGGVIISFIAIFKNLLAMLQLAPFWQGLSYSINYAFGFILIDQSGATLATKQPAFTANAVAGTLDFTRGRPEDRTDAVVDMLVRVSRSQFASFLGNLLVVFPGTFLLAWIYDLWVGHPIASGAAARALLADQHLWQSPSLFYACNTGAFLFLSGIIAGYVQNKMRFGRIPERIIQHPELRGGWSAARLGRISRFLEKHAGAIIGSLALALFLGMAGLLGRFFGIPFDIRHVTIAAGNASIGFYGLDPADFEPSFLWPVFFGVMSIGFLNFLVSFSLSFYVAMRSRGLHLYQMPAFLKVLGRQFLHRPLDFFRPPKDVRS
jgi:site-specific recombinase